MAGGSSMRHDGAGVFPVARHGMTTPEILAISTTCSSREAAEALGRELVETRLAACVQVEGPIASIYRWQGVVETATEWRCLCKTTAEREAACVAAILAAHDYDTPQIAVARVAASPAYAACVGASVAAV
jgi:periplasmic divalent cation tolerance protein